MSNKKLTLMQVWRADAIEMLVAFAILTCVLTGLAWMLWRGDAVVLASFIAALALCAAWKALELVWILRP